MSTRTGRFTAANRCLPALLALMLFPSRARTQEGPPIESYEILLQTAAGSETPRDKSPGLAFTLSFGSMAVPVGTGWLLAAHSGGSNQGGTGGALIVAGILIGPAAGYFYDGSPKRAWLGIGIRGATAAAAGIAMVVTPPTGDFDIDILFGVAGLALIGLEALIDCILAPIWVDHHNRRGRVSLWIDPGGFATDPDRPARLALRASW